jgi:hypothetical protein
MTQACIAARRQPDGHRETPVAGSHRERRSAVSTFDARAPPEEVSAMEPHTIVTLLVALLQLFS